MLDKDWPEYEKKLKLKLLRFGYSWVYTVGGTGYSMTRFEDRFGKNKYCVIYVYAQHRNKGVFTKLIDENNDCYLTLPECNMVEFFKNKGAEYICLKDGLENHLQVIETYYGTTKAKRSGIPYINHIYEGLGILGVLNASEEAKTGFIWHPLYQDAKIYSENNCASKYSYVADTFLRKNYKINNTKFLEKHLQNKDIRDMLIADKVQNYKDFTNNKDKYAERKDIEKYFLWWFDQLSISHQDLNKYINYIS